MRRILLILWLAVAFVGFVKGQESASNRADAVEVIKKEILHVEDVQDQAILKRDAEVLDRIYADDFAYTNPYGELVPRTEVLDGFRSGKTNPLSMDHDDIRMRIYGNTIVLTGRAVGGGHFNGKVSLACPA